MRLICMLIALSCFSSLAFGGISPDARAAANIAKMALILGDTAPANSGNQSDMSACLFVGTAYGLSSGNKTLEDAFNFCNVFGHPASRDEACKSLDAFIALP